MKHNKLLSQDFFLSFYRISYHLFIFGIFICTFINILGQLLIFKESFQNKIRRKFIAFPIDL